jgi:hypothetical protein
MLLARTLGGCAMITGEDQIIVLTEVTITPREVMRAMPIIKAASSNQLLWLQIIEAPRVCVLQLQRAE